MENKSIEIKKDITNTFNKVSAVFEKLKEMKEPKGIPHTMFVLYAFGEKLHLTK